MLEEQRGHFSTLQLLNTLETGNFIDFVSEYGGGNVEIFDDDG